MTLDAELAAVRAVARTLRSADRPMEVRRLGALASSLDHCARGIARGMDFLRAEAEGRKLTVDRGDPAPYRGLSLEQAARVLAERGMAAGMARDPDDPDGAQRLLAAEVDGFCAAVTTGGPRTAPLARGVSAADPGADGPGLIISEGSRTSKAAAHRAAPRTGSARWRVLEAVAAVARDPRTVGLTDVEVQRATGLNPNTARPRRVELVDGGWLADSGQTREHFGREHAVWVLTDKAARLVATGAVGAGAPGAGS